jgi:serine protease inhibitor
VVWEIPKFDVTSKIDLKAPMQRVGLKRAYESSPDDLSFGGISNKDLYIETHQQASRLRFFETGFQGAASEVALIGVRGSAQTVTFDTPFAVWIVDSSNRVVGVARIVKP